MSERWYKNYFGKGTKYLPQAYLDTKGRLFILLEDLSAEEQEDHNCDQMGCASVGPHTGNVFVEANKFNQLQSALKECEKERLINANQVVALNEVIDGLKENIKRIGEFAFDWMEGSGSPEFDHYSWIVGYCNQALKKAK